MAPKKDWVAIDIHNMGSNFAVKKKVETKKEDEIKNSEPKTAVFRNNLEKTYLLRHVKRIVRRLALKESQTLAFIDVRARIKLDSFDVASLVAFADLAAEAKDDKSKSRSLQNLDQALDKLFVDVEHVDPFEDLNQAKSFVADFLPRGEIVVVFAVPVLLAFYLFFLFLKGWRLTTILMLLYFISCAWEYAHMYQKEIAERYVLFVFSA